MKRTVSLCKNYEFYRAYKKGAFKAGRHIVIYALKNRNNMSRLGISVGKKVGNSVQRSRFTRVIRENYRLLEDRIAEGYDIVVAARPIKREAAAPNRKIKAIALPEYEDIRSEMIWILKKLGLLDKQ